MTDTEKDSPADMGSVDLGIYARPALPAGLADLDRLAIALAVLWFVGAALFFVMSGDGAGLRVAVAVLAVGLPPATILVGAIAARNARILRHETARLHSALDGLRQAQIATRGAGGAQPSGDVARKLGEIVEQQKRMQTALSTFISIRPQNPAPAIPAPAADTGQQASLELGGGDEPTAPPVDTGDFIAALQFPESPEDKEGFRALRRALQDRRAAELIQAAQDVLTLLSQDGIYMDDLHPERARPDTWRRFARGERGRSIAGLGGIRDRSSLALTATRMRSDTIFRDAAHHFLRKFDHTFAGFEKTANDADIVALSDTRTARAFMLLGRVTGTFD